MSFWLKICGILSSSIGKIGEWLFFFPVVNFFFLNVFLLAEGKKVEELLQNTRQLKISTVRNTFLKNLLSAWDLHSSCKNVFTDAFLGEFPRYRCWAGGEGWPHTGLATLKKLRLAKGWPLVIIMISMMKFVGAQQVVLKKPMQSST